ncbi:MAG: ATP-binding protein [Candidatus Neomarinimicrobiota bacterium]
MNLYRRHLEKTVVDQLGNRRALFILGTRRVGKTSLLKRVQDKINEEKTLYFDLENLNTLALFKRGIDTFMNWFDAQGYPKDKRFILFLDEIQYLDEFSNFVKLAVDHHSDRMKLILSGSSAAQIKYKFRDSLAGRKFVYTLYPLTFREFLIFKNESRMVDLLGGDKNSVQHESLAFFHDKLKSLYSEFLLFGGYPEVALTDSQKDKVNILEELIHSYVLRDIRNLFTIEHIDAFNKLTQIIAIQSGQLFNSQSISKEIGIDYRTVNKYLQILSDTFIVSLLKPLFTNKKRELKKMPKVYLLDTGIRNMLLSNFNPINLRTDRGELLESGVFSALWKRLNTLETLYYWRTRDGKEVDFVLQKGVDYIPFEVKKKKTAVNHLLAFSVLYDSPERNLVRFDEEKIGQKGKVSIVYPWYL